MITLSLELERRAHHASQVDKEARRKAGKGEEGELRNTCTTNDAQTIVAVCVCNTVPFGRANCDDGDDDDDDDKRTGMCYTLSSCRSGRLVGKQLFRP